MGVTVDEQLTFNEHIEAKSKAAYAAMKSINNISTSKVSCKQDIFMRLYEALVIPRMEFGISVISTAHEKAVASHGKIHRWALLNATGCLFCTSTEAMEILTNQEPLESILLKERRSQNM